MKYFLIIFIFLICGVASSSQNGPDLIVKSIKYDKNTISVLINNQGDIITSQNIVARVKFCIDDCNYFWETKYKILPHPLKSNEIVNITIPYKLSKGMHTISVYIDDEVILVETNKENNHLSHEIYIN